MGQLRVRAGQNNAPFSGFERRPGLHKAKENCLPGHGFWRFLACAERWPREESNLRARIRSPSLYPLSYGAVRSSVAAPAANLRGERVADGTRTHDHLDHNQGLYQLSYSHRAQSAG